MLFFKAFILPYFDYCISLSIYFNKSALQKLCKMYYFCIYKLLDLKFVNLSLESINIILNDIDLYSFQHRLLYRLFMFIYNVDHSSEAPTELKECLAQIVIKNRFYNLRSNGSKLVKSYFCKTKFGDSMFINFSAKLINKFSFIKNMNKFSDFNFFLNNNMNLLFYEFVKLFNKFDLNMDFNFFRNRYFTYNLVIFILFYI